MIRTLIQAMMLLAVSCPATAQLFNDNPFRNSQNKLYWQNRKPHAAYFQQDVAYTIHAVLDEKTDILSADEELQYWNNSPDTLYEVYFHLYQNAFTKGSYLEELHKVNQSPVHRRSAYAEQGLGTTVEDMKADGLPVSTELNNTVLKVKLNKPLLPSKSIRFTLQFKTYFGTGDYRRRMAMYNSFGQKHYNGVHWYPRICVYDAVKGWDQDQHLNKELYGDYGYFDVWLNMASNTIVEATGELKNESEMYAGGLREKLDVKNFASKPWNEKPSLILPYDPKQRKTWHFQANNVHDFAFTCDPGYRIGETTWNGIRCIALVNEAHASKWQTASEYVAKIIETFSRNFGMYEYPKMVAADANDGMEYPMLTLDGGAEPDFHGLLVHEIGHNWFYGMLGNNETYRAFLDEGFTQFLTAFGLQAIDGDTLISSPEKNRYKRKHREPSLNIDRSVYNRYMMDAVRNDDKTLNTHSNDFHSALGHENGYSNVYHKTAVMLYNLRYVLGDSLFMASMQHYVAQWKICHPYPADFRSSIIQYTHTDLNWFFDQWLETSKHIDYGIKRIRKGNQTDEYKIRFKRYGQMQMPVDFSVYNKKNERFDFTIPNTSFVKSGHQTILPVWYGWDLLYPEYIARVQIPGGIKRVEIDPEHFLADIDPMDNVHRRGMKMAPESKTLRFDYLLNQPADWKKYRLWWRPDIWWNAIDGIKAGIHLEGAYFGTLRKLSFTGWFNSPLLTDPYYTTSSQTPWLNTALFNYTLRYESPLNRVSAKYSWGIESRFIEAFARHALYLQQQWSDRRSVKLELKSMYRSGNWQQFYLQNPAEWNSVAGQGAGSNATKENTSLQLRYTDQVPFLKGWMQYQLTLHAPLTYQYTYFQTEAWHQAEWKKLEFRSRLILRLGSGNDIPNESALFLQGASPEEQMESKWNRSRGIVPDEWLGTGNSMSAWHAGGGLNIRGYQGRLLTGHTAGGETLLAYKSRSGAAFNLEIDFDRFFRIHPPVIRQYLHFDSYVFGDAGMISRSRWSGTAATRLGPAASWSKVLADAGVGMACTIKKWGPFEKINPFTLRVDFPFWVSQPPTVQKGNLITKESPFAFRWLIGVNRSF